MQRLRKAKTLAGALILAGSAGCAALLGLDDVTYRASVGDAAADAEASDARAEYDAADSNASESGPFCRGIVPAPYLCADYDQLDAAVGGYREGVARAIFDIQPNPFGVFAVSSDASVSPARSLLLHRPSAGTECVLLAREAAPVDGGGLELRVAFRVEATATDNGADLFGLVLRADGGDYARVGLQTSSLDSLGVGTVSLVLRGLPSDAAGAGPWKTAVATIRKDDWFHVRMIVRRFDAGAAGTYEAQLLVDDAGPGASQIFYADGLVPTIAIVEEIPSSGNWVVRYDNFRVDLTP